MYGYRKYSVIILIIIIGVIFRLNGYINGSELVELLKVSVAAFFASNIGKSIVNTIKDKISK